MPAPTPSMIDSEPDRGSLHSHVIETHVSYVVFIGDRVYKLKKPIVTDFVDFRGVEARRAGCEAEVELNRRLAPDVYLGVAALTGPEAGTCDYLVVMRRMPDDRRLTRLVSENDRRLSEKLREIAAVMAAFHANAERSPDIDEAGRPESILANWAANTRALRRYGSVGIDVGLVDSDRSIPP